MIVGMRGTGDLALQVLTRKELRKHCIPNCILVVSLFEFQPAPGNLLLFAITEKFS
jgi:hypothetical protein